MVDYKRSTTLAINPQVPDLLYAGAPADSIYYSTDGGSRWLASTFFANTSTFALDPNNTLVVFAGTSGGAARSANSGTTWFDVSSDLTASAFAITVDPVQSSIVYTATSDGKLRAAVDRRFLRLV